MLLTTKESNIKNTLNKNSKENIYCGVQDSTCNRDLRFYNHSLCCLKCKYNCSNCSVKKVSQCDQFCSKEDIISYRIEELSKEKDKHIKALDNIYIEINRLSEELK